VRRLRLLTSAIVVADTMLYAALVPLLPHYKEELGLSKAGAGLVVAAFAAGTMVASIPGGVVASRFGPRRAVVFGLLLMSLSSIGFAFADSAAALGVARFAQGVGSALSWAGALSWLIAAAPRDRRGEVLGTAIGTAIFGALLGPAVGAAASVVGSKPAFVAVSVLGVALAGWAVRTEKAPAEPQPVREALRALGRGEIRVALLFMVLPALLFGLVGVLVPLKLDEAGWGAVAIGAVFLVAAAFETVATPVVGRISDRAGRMRPLRLALAASAISSLGLAWAGSGPVIAVLVVAAAVSYGAFWGPASALLADAAERIGLAQGLAFGLMNFAWAAGNVVGPAAGGALADVAGDALPFVLAAAACAVVGLAPPLTGILGTPRIRVPEEP
jgi:MFS family permease